jgi:hypothetical protein
MVLVADEYNHLWSIKLRADSLYVQLPEEFPKESKEK